MNKKGITYQITLYNILKNSIFLLVLICSLTIYFILTEFTFKAFLYLSFIWIFHARLLLEYFLEDLGKKFIIDKDRVTILKKRKAINFTLTDNVHQIVLYRTKPRNLNSFFSGHYDIFEEFRFLKVKLSNGKTYFFTSLLGNAEKIGNALNSYHPYEIKHVIYPSLIFQKLVSKFN